MATNVLQTEILRLWTFTLYPSPSFAAVILGSVSFVSWCKYWLFHTWSKLFLNCVTWTTLTTSWILPEIIQEQTLLFVMDFCVSTRNVSNIVKHARQACGIFSLCLTSDGRLSMFLHWGSLVCVCEGIYWLHTHACRLSALNMTSASLLCYVSWQFDSKSPNNSYCVCSSGVSQCFNVVMTVNIYSSSRRLKSFVSVCVFLILTVCLSVDSYYVEA